MAKKKAKSKAKQAKKKPAKPARKGPARKPPKKPAKNQAAKKKVASAVALEAVPQATSATEPAAAGTQRDGSLEHGAAVIRMFGQLAETLSIILEKQTASETRENELQQVLSGLARRLGVVESRVLEAAQPHAAPSPPATHLTSAPPGRLATIQGWREQIWIEECAQSHPLRLPRATVVGRALFELVATQEAASPTAKDVFATIQGEGRHHLDGSLVRALEVHETGGKDQRADANSKLSKRFNERCEWLAREKVARVRDRNKWLSDRGRDAFDGWPEWGVRDDDGWECYGIAQYATSEDHGSTMSNAATSWMPPAPR